MFLALSVCTAIVFILGNEHERASEHSIVYISQGSKLARDYMLPKFVFFGPWLATFVLISATNSNNID
jgi:hypothetical protein